MNNNPLLSSRLMFGAAIVGLVGAAGVFIYEQIYAEKRRSMLVREVARLDKQVTSMKTELENLRELQKETQLKRAKLRKRPKKPAPAPDRGTDQPDGKEQSYASDSEYFTDYQSIVGTDREMDSDEFYDVHTDDEDEDDTLRETRTNGQLNGVFDEDNSLSESPKKSTGT